MKKELFYTSNYYNLVREYKTATLINFLNKKELRTLVEPSLVNLKNKIFNKISLNEDCTDYTSLLINEEAANKALSDYLLELEEFKIVPSEIKARLFTGSFAWLFKRIFKKDGLHDEKYGLQTEIHSWLEECLVSVLIKDERFKPLPIIFKVLSEVEIMHHFYSALIEKIPANWISEQEDLWTNSNDTYSDILETIRTFDKDYFRDYENQLASFEGQSPWKYTSKAKQFSDYAMFNDQYHFKNSVLLEKNIHLWLIFWDNLKIPILQDIPLHIIKPETILSIASKLENQKDEIKSNIKVLAQILLDSYFQNSIKATENLSFYNDTEKIGILNQHDKKEDVLQEGKKIIDSWQENRVREYTTLIKLVSTILSLEEISEWLFSYNLRPKNTVYDDYFNSELNSLIVAYGEVYKSKLFDEPYVNFNLSRFNYLASKVEGTADRDKAEKLISNLINYIKSDKFHWDYSFAPQYWDSLKGIGYCLSLFENPLVRVNELLDDFKLDHEGWKAEYIDSQRSQSESFIMCGVILLLEHDSPFNNTEEKENFFRSMLSKTIHQSRFEKAKNSTYIIPLVLLYLVANQIILPLKAYFETTLIRSLDDIEDVVKILSYQEYKLDPSVISEFQQRINIEFTLLRKKMTQRTMKRELEQLEKGIAKLSSN